MLMYGSKGNSNQTALIYTRVSTTEQAENNLSLDSQHDACQQYAQRQGYNVVQVFRDEGQSAKTTDRKEFLNAIEYCRKNKGLVDIFIVWKLDRFARNSQDHHAIKGMLAGMGVRLESATEPIDDSATGKLMETILAGFGQFDNELRAERSRNGMVRRTEQGSWQHGAPTGYDCYRDELGRPTLKQNSDAPAMRKLLLAFHSGLCNQSQIAGMAKDLGLKGKGGKSFSKQTVCNWLRSPVYAGWVHTSLADAPVKGLHDGLVTMEIFNDNQDIILGKKRNYASKRTSQEYPLRDSGFLKCGTCNNPLTASAPRGNGGTYPRYSCTTCRSSVTGKPVSVSKDILHQEFIETLETLTPTAGVLKLFETVLTNEWSSQYQEARTARIQLDRELGELEEFKSKTLNKFVNGDITSSEKSSLTQQTDSQILTLRLTRSELVENEVDIASLISYATTFIKDSAKMWQDAPFEQKVWFQNLIFPEGITYEFGKGLRTGKLGACYRALSVITQNKSNMVGPAGFEPATNRL